MNDEQIKLRLPINTPLEDFKDLWISAVVAKAGTQKKAARTLRIAPATISRRLNRKRRKQ
jgi:hypothetical protein